MDLASYLAQDNVYGSSVLKDLKIALKFAGKPATSKNHQYKKISEDVICDGVNVPLSREENLLAYSTQERSQRIGASNPNIESQSDWLKVESHGANTANQGKLTISAYSTLNTYEYAQIFTWECDNGILESYTTTGETTFLAPGGNVDWSCKVKTTTNRPGSQDICNTWNNSN